MCSTLCHHLVLFCLQVKHPRRDGVLVFATETAEEFPQWIKAFKSGATIEVQPVSTVEEMRITDLEMQKRWTNPDTKDPFNEAEVSEGGLLLRSCLYYPDLLLPHRVGTALSLAGRPTPTTSPPRRSTPQTHSNAGDGSLSASSQRRKAKITRRCRPITAPLS